MFNIDFKSRHACSKSLAFEFDKEPVRRAGSLTHVSDRETEAWLVGVPLVAGSAPSPLPTWPGAPLLGSAKPPPRAAPALRAGPGVGPAGSRPRVRSVRSSRDAEALSLPNHREGRGRGGRGASCGLSLFLNYKKTGNGARERAKFKGGSGKPPRAAPGRPPARSWRGRGCRVRDECLVRLRSA